MPWVRRVVQRLADKLWKLRQSSKRTEVSAHSCACACWWMQCTIWTRAWAPGGTLEYCKRASQAHSSERTASFDRADAVMLVRLSTVQQVARPHTMFHQVATLNTMLQRLTLQMPCPTTSRVALASPVPAQMWQGWPQSRRRCGARPPAESQHHARRRPPRQAGTPPRNNLPDCRRSLPKLLAKECRTT